jgi:hypothetical protein
MTTITKVKATPDFLSKCYDCGVRTPKWKVKIGDHKILLCHDCLTELSLLGYRIINLHD